MTSVRWSPFHGAVVGFYSLPIIVLLREAVYSGAGGAQFKDYLMIAIFAGLIGGGMGWMVCILKNGWTSGRYEVKHVEEIEIGSDDQSDDANASG